MDAKDMLKNMNLSANPCDNFYNFVCGNWRKEHTTHSSFDYVSTELLYKLNNNIANYIFVEEYILQKVGSPSLLTLMSYEKSARYTDVLIDWTSVFVNIKRLLDIDIAFTIGKFNLKGYKKTVGIFLIPRSKNTMTGSKINEEYNSDFISKERMVPLYGDDYLDDIVKRIKADLNELITFTGQSVQLSVKDLQNMMNRNGASKINWTRYFTLMFDGIENVSLDLENDDFKIYVNDIEDLIKVNDFISELDDIVLALLIQHTVQDVINGVRLPKPSIESCTRFVEQMLTGIKSAFRSMVQKVDWMDSESKQAALEKVDNMKDIIGVPEWVLNGEELDCRSSKVYNFGSNFLLNLLNLKARAVDRSLESLGRNYSIRAERIINPLVINAHYEPTHNLIGINPGILHYPFFSERVQAFNYGEIGMVLGHELTHGFDNYGRNFDKFGLQRKLWSNSSIEEYKKRTKCFVNQYNNFGSGKNSSWCTDALQFIREVHAPSPLRVIGTLQNSEEFSRAWNCPKGSPMNPNAEKCKIW
ncbi:hypothetical protein C0J52_02835 [Blattella germanica]|nr:hypothetical protein C0J52_02835 [Blattella germanica]